MNFDTPLSNESATHGTIEILLFSLGSREIFGLNVFKIREVTDMFPVTEVPGQSGAMEGIVSLRGQVMPVVNLPVALGMNTGQPNNKLIVSEFASRSVAFQVTAVDKIIRVPWSEVKPPQRYDSEQGLVFGVVLLADGTLVSLVDIESVCHKALPDKESESQSSHTKVNAKAPVFFVDDSLVARRKIGDVLSEMGLQHAHAINGVEAEQKLLALANSADNERRSVAEKVALILVDEEMPGMDGCTLTRKLKNDPRFKDIPFVMYSSLTSEENARRGMEAGVNIYVKKFDTGSLSRAIGQLLASGSAAQH